MSEIPVLPPEVISMILDFLTFRERLALATVSKQWHDLVFGPKLCQQQLVFRVSSTKGPSLGESQPSLPVQRCRRVQVDCRGLDEEKVALGKRLLLESPVQHLAVIGSDLEMKWVLEECLSLMSRLMFEPICNKYQKLERLSFGMSGGQFGKFLTESCIAHINKLPALKILQLVRMFLDNVNWSLCRNQLQKIRLVSSPIDGRAAQQLAATFPELRELFLDYGYLRQPAEAFEIAENFSEEQSLRRRLPRCRVSYYDCHVESLYDTCSGRRRDAGGVPSS
ncbi:hypothetical protein pipiens_012719 [Culex pipiens pipiens]|uniref:F-box domain-containing protein n=1 Tax=Culex pipiens pipiens TaxID=38569 RepID=A0ABD1D420_CULPP